MSYLYFRFVFAKMGAEKDIGNPSAASTPYGLANGVLAAEGLR